jgi:protein gp37
MAVADWITFQILTKRSARARALLGNPSFPVAVHHAIERLRPTLEGIRRDWGLVSGISHGLKHGREWPLRNVWHGVSTEDRTRFAERTTDLVETPAAIRYLSVEPLLEDLGEIDLTGIDWVIVGGESGPGARPMSPRWVRSIRDQCVASGVSFHFKQWGVWTPYLQDGTLSVLGRVVGFFDDEGRWYEGTLGSFRNNKARVVEKMVRVGKKAAGRVLDGRTWDQFPQPTAEAYPR